jgi:hypothetical protein
MKSKMNLILYQGVIISNIFRILKVVSLANI